MGGIDRMIATALSYEIKKELKLDILKKTERELFLEHGMSIKLSIEHFHKFSSSLRNNSNIDVKKFENNCIAKVIKVKKRDDNFLVSIIEEDLRDLIEMTKPQHIIPGHGSLKQETPMVELAVEMGYRSGENVHLTPNGKVLKL